MPPRSLNWMPTNQPTLRDRCSGRLLRRALFSLMGTLVGYALLFGSHAAAQTNQPHTELDVVSYESELHRVAESVKHADQIPRLRKSLPRGWPVQVGGKTVEVSTAWLAADLKKMDEDPAKSGPLAQEITSRLGAMRHTAEEFQQGTAPADIDAAHLQLDKILSGREFG